MSAAPDTLTNLRCLIDGLLSQLRKLTDPAGPGGALLAAISEVEAGDNNIGAIKNSVRELAKALDELQGPLRNALMQAEKLECTQPGANLGSETYWAELIEAMRKAAARSENAALSVLLKSFAEAFAAWELNVCERLAKDEFLGAPRLSGLQESLGSIVTALRAGEHAAAVPGISLLVHDHPYGLKSPLDGFSRAAAFLVLGRIRLYDFNDDVEALACFEKAREAMPQDGRVHVAFGEYYRMKKDEALARDLYRQAIEVLPDRPDGYIGMGLWCEAQAWWDEAQDWYAQAVDTVLRRAALGDPLAQLGQLLAPVSGALYLRLAQSISTANPTAGLAAVDKAIGLGVKGKGKYPLRAAFQLKGEILEAQQRQIEAAEAFFQAGRYNSWENNTDIACKLHERASELDPQLVKNYWYWADELLVTSSVSKPPYVDPDKIMQSLDVWNRGVNISPPDEASGWPYLTRALIAQKLAELPGAERFERYWETAAFVEQALLLDPVRAYSWVILARVQHILGNHLNALHSTETALLCDPEDAGAIEQRIIVLTNLDRYADVRPLLTKRSIIGSEVTGWLNAVEAHITLNESFQAEAELGYERGLVTSDVARNSGWDAPWSSIDRARLLHLARRTDEARQQYEELWHKFDEKDVDSQLDYAWAALMTGEYEATLSILISTTGDRIVSLPTVQRYFGFCYLLRGELDSAREHFDLAVGLANSVSELDTWLYRDIESVEVLQRLAGRPYATAAKELLDQCKNSALARRAALKPPSSPMQEMRRLIGALEANNETDGWNWIGAHAAAARLNLESNGWREASELYRGLQTYPGRFFTAQQGLDQAFYGLVEEEHGRAEKFDAVEAAAYYDGSLITAESAPPENRTLLAALYNKRVDLERRRIPTRFFGQTGMQRLPAVTPLAIEVASNLVPLVKGEDGTLLPQFAKHLVDMRSELNDLLGFTAPPVLIRSNEAYLLDGTYIIILNEIPLVSGNIDLTRGLCNETVDRLALLDVKAEEAVNPVNGSNCAWVGEGDWQKVKDVGLKVWTPTEYILLHLSTVIRKNSVELVDIQMVADLLKAKVKEQYAKILSAQGGLARFTSVIHALLAEEVPIKDLPNICNCYLDSLNLSINEIPEEIRRLEAVRKEIPGNIPDTPVYRLGEGFVSLIEEGIQHNGEAAVLALEPEPTMDLLTAVRNEMANTPPLYRNPVLFVEDWRIRPFVRKLVELEFPHLFVLSRREALTPDSMPVLATIEVELHPTP